MGVGVFEEYVTRLSYRHSLGAIIMYPRDKQNDKTAAVIIIYMLN